MGCPERTPSPPSQVPPDKVHNKRPLSGAFYLFTPGVVLSALNCNASSMPDTGFPYAANSSAKVLILGSMPGQKSLTENQYYAHPRNMFWPIMAEMFNFDTELDYDIRLKQLQQNKIALWDVVHQCIRPGSLDSAIDITSVVANDFMKLFQAHPQIQAIFFNGRKAEELYCRLVTPSLSKRYQQFNKYALPSTSPANAGLNRQQKFEAWKIIKETLEIL